MYALSRKLHLLLTANKNVLKFLNNIPCIKLRLSERCVMSQNVLRSTFITSVKHK